MRILIFGSGDFAPTVLELTRACGHEPVGLIDDFNEGPNILGNLESVAHSHPPGEYAIAMAIGYRNLVGRWKAWERVKAAGYRAPVLIHPRAYVAESALVEAGSMVMAGALVDVRVAIGEATVLWPGACVNHDTRIGDNCFISPNATLCGFVNLGANCFVGAGAAIADHCAVPASSFIKMLARHTGERRN